MQTALRMETTVLPGHRLEVSAPELPEGAKVEVIVVLPQGASAVAVSGVNPSRLGAMRVVTGGERRQDSVANAFDQVAAASDVESKCFMDFWLA